MKSLPLLVALPGDSVYIRDGSRVQPGTVKYATVVQLNARAVHRYTVVVDGRERIVSKSKILIAC